MGGHAMSDNDDPLDGVERCPQCGEPVREAHARGSEIVLAPCGHSIAAMSSLDVPPEARE